MTLRLLLLLLYSCCHYIIIITIHLVHEHCTKYREEQNDIHVYPTQNTSHDKKLNTLENNNNIILLYMTVFKVNVWMNWNGAGYK